MPLEPTVHALSNGLTLLIEPMSGVRSAAMSLLLPCGAANDPADAIGAAGILGELSLRGAGSRTSRELSDDLDRLGLQRGMSASLYHTRYTAAATANNLLAGLSLYADVVQRPRLDDAEFEPAQQLALQELEGLDDDPRSLVLIELRRRHWPDPLGRNTMGVAEHLEALTIGRCRTEFERRYTPRGAILGIAGDVDPQRVIELVERSFGGWNGPAPVAIDPNAVKTTAIDFIEQKTEQTHIGIACPYVRDSDPDYYTARIAAEVLSGGSSGRLFTEIREKRGLCYSVGTSYAPLRDRASLLGYAGTSNERAQATLDAFLEEMAKLQDGVTEAEVERHKVGLLSNTVMSGESTGARAGGITSDFFSRGRVRTLAEIVEKISAVTAKDVDAFVRRQPLGPFTVVTVGPTRLNVNAEAAKLSS